MNSVKISMHAVDRYIDRIDPTASSANARWAIRKAYQVATRLREKTSTGDSYFLANGLRLVVAEEPGGNTVLTVLSIQDPNNPESIPPLALELDAEFQAARNKLVKAKKAESESVGPRLRGQEKTELLNGIKRRDQSIKNLMDQISKLTVGTELRTKLDKQIAHSQLMAKERLTYRTHLSRILFAILRSECAGVPQVRAAVESLRTDIETRGLLEYIESKIAGGG